MSKPITRLATAQEDEEARKVAIELVEALRTSPSVAVGMAAVSTFVVHAFIHAMKREYILKAFDDWTAHCRKQIEGELRRAHN